jgi:hypothetical protein
MKRVFVIVICLSILYAGVAWAFSDCENFIVAAAAHHHGDNSEDHHLHDDTGASQQGDSGKIHCPNLLDALLLVGSRSSIEAKRRAATAVDCPSFNPPFEGQRSASLPFVLGPPGLTVFQSRPLRLLLSVIRI